MQAGEMWRHVLEMGQKVLGPEHIQTMVDVGFIAGALRHQEELVEAENDYRTVLKLRTKALGPVRLHIMVAMG